MSMFEINEVARKIGDTIAYHKDSAVKKLIREHVPGAAELYKRFDDDSYLENELAEEIHNLLAKEGYQIIIEERPRPVISYEPQECTIKLLKLVDSSRLSIEVDVRIED